jgi:hypothetical protein
MRFVNMSSRDFVLSRGDLRCLPVPMSGVKMTLNQLVNVAANPDDYPIWEAVDDLRLELRDGSRLDAFDGSYQWNTTDIYVVDPAVAVALGSVYSDLKFAVPVNESAPGVYRGLLLVDTRRKKVGDYTGLLEI